jgi:hypothetical protein
MKKIVLLFLVIVCFFLWSNLDVNQRPDALLRLIPSLNPFGPSIILNLNDRLMITEDNVEETFGQLYFGCGDEGSSLGDRVCWAYIDNFNGISAEMVAFFFVDGKFTNFRVSANRESHSPLLAYIKSNFNYVGVSPRSRIEVGQDLGVWMSNNGRVTSTLDQPLEGDNAMLVWSRI